VLKSLFLLEQYTEELKEIHGTDADLKSVPFNVVVAYVAGGGTPHGRYVQFSILFGYVFSIQNCFASYMLALGDGVVDHGSYGRQRSVYSTSSSSRSH
jgi:hypothetical protein